MAGDASRINGKKGGRPKGPESLEKSVLREETRRMIAPHLAEMIEAQTAHAKGLKYLVARDKATGKFSKLTEELAERILSGEDAEREMLEVWEKDPSVQAFTDLLNRLVDKPIEAVEQTVQGSLEIKWKS